MIIDFVVGRQIVVGAFPIGRSCNICGCERIGSVHWRRHNTRRKSIRNLGHHLLCSALLDGGGARSACQWERSALAATRLPRSVQRVGFCRRLHRAARHQRVGAGVDGPEWIHKVGLQVSWLGSASPGQKIHVVLGVRSTLF